MSADNKERRRHKRYGIKGCTVQYKPASLLRFFNLPSERFLVLDLSPHGVHFITKESFKKGTKLLLNISAPLLKDEIIQAKGHVVWIKKSKELDAYSIGLEFTSLSKPDQNRLKFLVDNAVMDKIDVSTRIYLKEVEKL